MGLETVTYIPELNQANPLGTDPKSQGDDHLRNIKKALLNSFPNFAGTAGSPKSVTLTEDQINDAALKSAAASITGLWDFDVSNEPTISGQQIARKRIVTRTVNTNYTLVLDDQGRYLLKSSGGAGETITIPANSSVAFDSGTVVTIVNNGGGDLSIAITTDTLIHEGTGNTGTRTLADHGVATLLKISSTIWFIMGGNSLT